MPRQVLESEPPYVYTSDRPDVLDFITGIGGREVSVGPRLVVSASDTVDRTLAASASVYLSIAMSAFANSSWPGLSADQGVILEKLIAGVTFSDASAQLQVLNIGINNFMTPIRLNAPLPYTAPALSDTPLYVGLYRSAMFLRKTEDSIVTAGPSLNVILKNLDGTNPHGYRATIFCIIRAVSNVYTDGHVSYPG